MKIYNSLISAIFIIFLSLTGVTYAETLNFGSSTYEGEVKKGRAHGVGIFTFSDGSTYEGKVKKNKIHGIGKYTDSDGNVFEGKFKYGKLKVKIDKKTRRMIKIKPETGIEEHFEIKGKGSVSDKWFEAEKNSSGIYELTAKGKRDMEQAKTEAQSSASSSGGACGG